MHVCNGRNGKISRKVASNTGHGVASWATKIMADDAAREQNGAEEAATWAALMQANSPGLCTGASSRKAAK